MTAPNGNSALSTCSFSSLPSEQELEFQEERSSDSGVVSYEGATCSFADSS